MMDESERALLDETVRAALGENGTGADAVLAELGWTEMLETEGVDAIAIVFDALGTTNTSATALDDVLASALTGEARADTAVLLPRFGTWDAPGRVDGTTTVHAVGLTTARVAAARDLLVVCTTGAEIGIVTVPTASADVRAVHGIDPDLGLHAVRVDLAGAAPVTLEPGPWDDAVAAGRIAVAHQLAGASRAMLALARTHAVDRVQFGRRIASFQAVRHRLADALVAVESLDAALGAAADAPGALTAALAKATAGRTARTVATHCQQVLAGIGFTTDHPFHRFLKRTMALEGLLGSTDELVVDIGRELLAARRVPTLVEL